MSTGLNTGTLTVASRGSIADGYVAILQLTFTTATNGTFTLSADDGEDTGTGNFSIIDA